MMFSGTTSFGAYARLFTALCITFSRSFRNDSFTYLVLLNSPVGPAYRARCCWYLKPIGIHNLGIRAVAA